MSNWLDKLLEAAEDEVDEVISSAIDSKDAQGIEDVNHAGTEVKDSDVSDDPNELVYDKVQTYSQDIEMGDEKTAGEVDIDNDDTDTTVKAGKQVSENGLLTRQEMQNVYSEAVAELIAESTDEINAKFKEKLAKLKEWKAKALAKEKAKEKKAKANAVAEAADINGMLEDIFDKMI